MNDLGLREFFPDAELVDFIRDAYGGELAKGVRELLASDPNGERGFTRAVRRSITREIEELSWT